ncbi:MAG: glutamate 5-kinase [Acidobacteriota bacterium]|nr:glutamate 5-kinase [Acidobacteriota bacterium]
MRCLVIKLGTSTVTAGEGEPSPILGAYADLCARLRALGWSPVIVTSGAVGAGRGPLGLAGKKLSLVEKQAAAAVGQGRLMETYRRHFEGAGLTVAQILLSRADISDRGRCNNARRALEFLLKAGVVPLVNENDTVATEELKFGDNDLLSALVANLLGAERLIILTDTGGLYTMDPRMDPDAALVAEVAQVTQVLLDTAGESRSGVGTGGMASKLRAARIASEGGATVTIAHGQHPERILELLNGQAVGTTVLPAASRRDSRKSWIAYGVVPSGKVMVDEGAVDAMVQDGRSLLPVGIRQVEGEFEAGEVVQICRGDGTEIGRGLVALDAGDLRRVMGCATPEVRRRLGNETSTEAIHRDDLTVTVVAS